MEKKWNDPTPVCHSMFYLKGFFAEPCKAEDGTVDMLNWNCGE